MSERSRPRHAPKLLAMSAAIELALASCTTTETPPPTPTQTQDGDPGIIKQFRTIAEGALKLFNDPPEGTVTQTRRVIDQNVFNDVVASHNRWELEIETFAPQQLDNPLAEHVRQVKLFTGPHIPATEHMNTPTAYFASLDQSRQHIGVVASKLGSALPGPILPTIVASAATGVSESSKALVAAEGDVCRESYRRDQFDAIYDSINNALDAAHAGSQPEVVIPPGPFLGSDNPSGFCAQ